MAIACLAFAADSASVTTNDDVPGYSQEKRIDEHVANGTPAVAESQNFLVHSHAARFDARATARSCEQWRQHLQGKWLPKSPNAVWDPRCLVVIHNHRDAYRAAIGNGGDMSYGSSWTDNQGTRITQRRIDLLVDPHGLLSAFAHELTHVVLADAFEDAPPLWANEGIAILSDSPEKQRLHQRDLKRSVEQQAFFHCAELTQLAGYPARERIPAFYGQSASLVNLLSRAGGSETLIPFLQSAALHGYDRALQETYGIAGLAGLHRQWIQEQSKSAAR